MDEGLIGAILEFVQYFIEVLGPDRAIGLAIIVFFGAVGWRLYGDWRNNRYYWQALGEKDRTIERLARQERQWRYVILVQLGLNPGRIKRILQDDDDDRGEGGAKRLGKGSKRK